MQHKSTISKYKVPIIIGFTIIIAGGFGLGIRLHNQYLHKALFTANSNTTRVYNSKLITLPKNWAIGWHYDCSNVSADKSAFDIIVSDSNGKPSITDGPIAETGKAGTGVTIMPDAGTYKVTIGSTGGCDWTAAAKRSSSVVGYDHEIPYSAASKVSMQPKTLIDVSGNGSGQTAKFTSSSDWSITYSYDCADFGGPGNFQFDVVNADGSDNSDTGANELKSSGSNTDHYYDSGTHYLKINTTCDWHVVVKDVNG